MQDFPRKGLALFDLDGTIVPWDTQLLFSNFIIRRNPIRWFLLIPFLSCLFLFFVRLLSENTMKRLFLGYLAGLSQEQIQRYAEQFVREDVLPVCYPEVLARLKQHQDAGDICLLVSASPSLYAQHIGKALGFAKTLGSDTENVDPFPFFPKMPYGNNKGETKASRLRDMGYLPDDYSVPVNSTAYSDSSADLPMLRACEKAVLVNPSKKLRRSAQDTGWEIMIPAVRPWTGTLDKSIKLLCQLFGFYTK